MKQHTTLNIPMDSQLKTQLEEVLSELGMDVSTAVTIFARKVVRQGRIPFELSLDVPNEETVKAMLEAETLSKNPEEVGYHDVGSMLDELLQESKDSP